MSRKIVCTLAAGLAALVLSVGPAAAQRGSIANKGGSFCMDAEGGVRQGAALIAWECHGQSNQIFYLTKQNGGQLKVFQTNLCVDIEGGQRNGRLLLWECHDGMNQKWHMRNNGEAGFNLVSAQFPDRSIAVPNQDWNLLIHGALRQTLKLRLASTSSTNPNVLWYSIQWNVPIARGARMVPPGQVFTLSPNDVISVRGTQGMDRSNGVVAASGPN